MKKILAVAVLLSAFSVNANAFSFTGNASAVNGDDEYVGTNLNVGLAFDSISIEPSWKHYQWEDDSFTPKETLKFDTYSLRLAKNTAFYSLGVMAGMTPEASIINYSNQFVGADFTVTLSPTGSKYSRLAGPSAHGSVGSGEGLTRLDLGVAAKYYKHEMDSPILGKNRKTGQTEYQAFAGASVLMLHVVASYTGYQYDDRDLGSTTIGFTEGLNHAISNFPESSMHVKVDVPFVPMLTPFFGYTKTNYKYGAPHSNNYELGAYMDFNMIKANVSYQLVKSNGHHDGYITAGVGLSFE